MCSRHAELGAGYIDTADIACSVCDATYTVYETHDCEAKPCERCGTAMDRPPRLSQSQWTRRRYCSFECRGRGIGDRLRKPLSESYVVRDSGCWEWTRAMNWSGYGRAREPLTRRRMAAHRMVWIELVGPIPEGLELDHLCRNRACVNPAHLEPVTASENQQRAAEALTHCRHGHVLDGRHARGRYCLTCSRLATRRYREKVRHVLAS